MKNFIKLFSFFLICCLAFTSLSSNISVSASSLSEKSMEIKFRQIIDMPIVEDEELLGKLIEAAAVTEWNYNEVEQRFERIVTYQDIDVSTNSNSVEVNKNGIARLLTQADQNIEVTAHDPITDKTYTQLVSGDSTDTTVIFDIDISPMFSVDKESMKKLKKSGNETGLIVPFASYYDAYWADEEEGVFGYRLHCNRFNGYLGNGRYYSSNISPQAILNFFASDCDFALATSTNCLADYGSNPYCAASPSSKQGKCSDLIGHYTKFHMHSSYSGPY